MLNALHTQVKKASTGIEKKGGVCLSERNVTDAEFLWESAVHMVVEANRSDIVQHFNWSVAEKLYSFSLTKRGMPFAKWRQENHKSQFASSHCCSDGRIAMEVPEVVVKEEQTQLRTGTPCNFAIPLTDSSWTNTWGLVVGAVPSTRRCWCRVPASKQVPKSCGKTPVGWLVCLLSTNNPCTAWWFWLMFYDN